METNFKYIPYDIARALGAKKDSGSIIFGLENLNDPFIPALQQDFIPPTYIADLIAGFKLNQPLFIFGPTGCAKTSSVRWLCAKFHLPIVSVTGHVRLEFADLIGHYTVTNGTLSWIDGPLLTAVRHGMVFCFDEITLCPPETLVGLHGILDRYPICVPETNEIVPVHEQFRFIATDNSNGCGDETGQYLGTLRQNTAFLNRCFFVKANFLEAKQEKQLLKAHCNGSIPEELQDKMLQFAQDVRFPAESDSRITCAINTTVSVRDLFRWADAIVLFSYLKTDIVYHALECSILYRLSTTDRTTLTQLYKAIFLK